jgi:hypothetical protein
MSRPVLWTAIALFLVGGGAFIYKHFVLGMPVQPDRSARVWRVEMSVLVRGHADRGRIELQIPRSDDSQIILDEYSYDDGLRFGVSEADGVRRAAWRGKVGESRRLAYTFRVHLPVIDSTVTRDETEDDGPKMSRRRDSIPDEIERTLKRLRLPDQGDPEAIIASAL